MSPNLCSGPDAECALDGDNVIAISIGLRPASGDEFQVDCSDLLVHFVTNNSAPSPTSVEHFCLNIGSEAEALPYTYFTRVVSRSYVRPRAGWWL